MMPRTNLPRVFSATSPHLPDIAFWSRVNIYPSCIAKVHDYKYTLKSEDSPISNFQLQHFAMAPNWDRLIRFVATDGRELRGQPILPSADFDVGKTTEETGLKAKVVDVKNNDIFDPATKVTDEEVTVKKLLGPVTVDEVPIIRCIGLNFIKHSTSSHTKV
jgi:hypothetical protein